ncbi:MAG: AraC family transcriptional regulator [Dorea sp.]|nr:AraC family transcriptional regulator [Dorea sp.]
MDEIILTKWQLFQTYHEVYKIPVGEFNRDGKLNKLYMEGGQGLVKMYLEDVKELRKVLGPVTTPTACYDRYGSVWAAFPEEDEQMVLLGPVQTGKNPNFKYRRIAAYPQDGFLAVARSFGKILLGESAELTEKKGRLKLSDRGKKLYDSVNDKQNRWNSFDELFDCVKNGDLGILKTYLESDELHTYLDRIMTDKKATKMIYQFAVTRAYHTAQSVCGATEGLTMLTVSYLEEGDACRSDASYRSCFQNMLYDFTAYIQEEKGKEYSALVRKAVRYIGENIYTAITVKEIAEYCLVAESTLQHQFKKETNMSISEMIRKRKIQKSCFFLKYTDLSCNDISVKLGYCSPSYFITQFKKEKGVTPAQYR